MTVDRIPDIVLERYRLNELPPADAARVAEEIDRDATLRERIAQLDRSDRDLQEEFDRLRRRLDDRPTTPRSSRALWLVPAAGILATLAIVAVTRSQAPPPLSPPAGDRIKGGSSLTVYRRTANGSERLADGSVARAGDLIRVGYRAAGGYGVILSLDGAGNVTMHLPPAGEHAAALQSDGTVLLDRAYELDDAPQWEQFYFVAGDRAFDVGPVLQAARAVARTAPQSPPRRLALPPEFDQASFTLQKESRR